MNEHFLSYLWKYRLISSDLKTTSGDPVSILHPGDQNNDSGPDFFNARLRIGNTIWAGNVEIHVRASDWYKHGHQEDHAYDNTILHVVYEPDVIVNHISGQPFQTLVIKNKYADKIFGQYQAMMDSRQWIPCYNQLQYNIEPDFNLWAPALSVERLINKSLSIKSLWESCGQNWEEAFYRHIAWSFGFKINSLPFELMAKSIPLKIIRQLGDKQIPIEALLFGQAGMLEENFEDQYPRVLLREYRFLSAKYGLVPINGSTWKFLRLRPSNFPTLRLSQFAKFIQQSQGQFFRMVEFGTFDEAVESFNVSASTYWDTHYLFDKKSVSRQKSLGITCTNLLIINGLVPFLFFYGLEKGQSALREKALNFLEQLPGESNSEIVKWEATGFPCRNAMQTQALLQLKRFYCDKKQCLGCRIGSVLLADGRQL